MKEVGKKKVLSVLVTVLCGFIIQTNIITLYGRNKQTKAKQCVRCWLDVTCVLSAVNTALMRAHKWHWFSLIWIWIWNVLMQIVYVWLIKLAGLFFNILLYRMRWMSNSRMFWKKIFSSRHRLAVCIVYRWALFRRYLKKLRFANIYFESFCIQILTRINLNGPTKRFSVFLSMKFLIVLSNRRAIDWFID